MSLQAVALGVALCDADHRVREVGGNNRGPRIRQYLENTDPPIAVDAPWAAPDRIVPPSLTRPGDLVFYSFHSERWDHLGLLAQPVRGKTLWSVEGNTSDESQRDGDAVVLKPRELDAGYAVSFARWEP